MIQIKPVIDHHSICNYCTYPVYNSKIIWQGIHVCVHTICEQCNKEYIEDLSVGHATYLPYKVELSEYTLIGDEKAKKWLGEPLKKSLQTPNLDSGIVVKIKKKSESKKVVILNCIDYLYGHSLLKLLNAQREHEEKRDFALIVIVQKALEWMVPDFVAEVWTVNIPFNNARNYYPSLNETITTELERFDQVYVSHAYSHPSKFNIEKFTCISSYRYEPTAQQRITFIWREDRFWINNYYVSKAVQKYPNLKKFTKPILYYQYWRVIRLFKMLKTTFPNHLFTVAGLGDTGKFPGWIDDCRVKSFNKDTENLTCQIYSQSQIVIGVHGSNMLLPSAQAGMTLDLMPMDRWGNYAQDILFQEDNNKMATYKYRFVPLELKTSIISKIVIQQLIKYSHYSMQMKEDLTQYNTSILGEKKEVKSNFN